MDTLLKTILIVLLVYLGLRILFRYAGPYLMRFLARKVAQRFEKAFQHGPFSENYESNSKEDFFGKAEKVQRPKSTKVVGEYIDYEEVED